VVRWVIACVVLASCGRYAFDTEADTLAAPPPAHIQRGLTVLSTTTRNTAVPIEIVDPTHAVLWFTVAVNTLDPSDGLVTGQLEAAQVRFERGDVGTQVSIEWQVVELPTLFAVQRGTAVDPGGGVPKIQIPIAPVDLQRSFALSSWRNIGTNYDEDDYLLARFLGSDRLELEVGFPPGGSALPPNIEWQVVRFGGATVQSGEVPLDAATAMTTVPLVADPAHSFLQLSWLSDEDIGYVAADLVRGQLTGDTLQIDRAMPGTPLRVHWFVISSPALRVRSGIAALAAGQATFDAPLDPPVDVNRAFVLLPAEQHMAVTPYFGMNPDDQVGIAWFTASLTASTVHVQRQSTLDAAELSWSVVEL
jgi:hypothetical protein